jgi:hypothetical protein
MTKTFDYNGTKIAVHKETGIKARKDWPAGWKPLTPETYRMIVAWRRDRSAFDHKLNYTPRLETLLAFDVRELHEHGKLFIGFPYTLHGLIENIKTLEITVDSITDKHGWKDYSGRLAINPKTKKGPHAGKPEPIRNISQLDSTPKNQRILFGVGALELYAGLSRKAGPAANDVFEVDDFAAFDNQMFQITPTVYITEGEWDAMALWELGFYVLSVINAGQTANIEPSILQTLSIYDGPWFVFDYDKGGNDCSRRILPAIPDSRRLAQLGKFKDPCEAIAYLGPECVKALIEDLSKPQIEAPAVHTSPKIEDLSADCLSGRLGEICQQRMIDGAGFPYAYAWPALVTVAGALVPKPTGDMRTNLNTALVGPVHNGKTQCVDHAMRILGVNHKPLQDQPGQLVITTKTGSAESLAVEIGDRLGEHAIYYPGELSHTLGKCMIQNASFASVLQDAFYADQNSLRIRNQKKISFNCCLSIVGGLIDTSFEEMFNANTLGGLYDRFLLGQSPTGFNWEYRDFSGESADALPTLSTVTVDPLVWKEKHRWENEEHVTGRVGELAIRVAVICASFDGKETLTVEDLEPHFLFAKAQERIRLILCPNVGENIDGKIQAKITNYLKRHGADGQWLSRRQVSKDTNVYKYGVPTLAKIFNGMKFDHMIDLRGDGTPGNPDQVRWIPGN